MGTTKTLDPTNHVEGTEHELEDQTNEGPEPEDFPPLFEDESDTLTEAELTGEEKPPEEKEDTAPPPSEGEEEPVKEAEAEGDQEPEKDEDEPQGDKPPPGYVPIGALHEERGKRQYQAQEIQELRQEIQALKDAPHDAKSGEDEFKVLSDTEFQALLETDPTEAILYDRQLRAHEAKQAQIAESQRREQAIVEQSTREMREAVPKIYDPGSTINQDLTRFAVEQGFSEEYLPILTDPRTKVIPPGSSEPVLLGSVAVGQVKMLHNLYQRGNGNDRAAIEKEVTERVTKEVTDRVTKQIMAKFKATPTPEYRSLGDIPGGEGEPFDVTKNLTMAQVDQLSEEQRRAYLGG